MYKLDPDAAPSKTNDPEEAREFFALMMEPETVVKLTREPVIVVFSEKTFPAFKVRPWPAL